MCKVQATLKSWALSKARQHKAIFHYLRNLLGSRNSHGTVSCGRLWRPCSTRVSACWRSTGMLSGGLDGLGCNNAIRRQVHCLSSSELGTRTLALHKQKLEVQTSPALLPNLQPVGLTHVSSVSPYFEASCEEMAK